MKAPLAFLALLVPLLAGGGRAQSTAQSDDARVVRLEELELTLTLPPLEGLTGAGTNRWRGRLGASAVAITLATLPRDTYAFHEPDDVLDLGPSHWSSTAHERNAPGTRRLLAGPFGHAPYAACERVELRARADGALTGVRWLLGGLLPEAGYWITLEAAPPPGDGDDELREFLARGIVYGGAVREHRWSDEEASARWKAQAPLVAHAKYAKPIRTEHYIVLTDSPGGESFAKKMEECHAAIHEAYPFDDVPGRRLLPVFLFRTADEYHEFYAASARIPRAEAERSKGHARDDYYATWQTARSDPVHLHEATHQLFANRLRLGGGGPWFQEGVAEYLSSKPGERAAVAGLVRKRAHVPLAELVALPSLPPSGVGDRARDARTQAALLIEFLRESPWARDAFPAFLTRVGRLPRGSGAELDAALEELYSVDLAGLEERWVEYCAKR